MSRTLSHWPCIFWKGALSTGLEKMARRTCSWPLCQAAVELYLGSIQELRLHELAKTQEAERNPILEGLYCSHSLVTQAYLPRLGKDENAITGHQRKEQAGCIGGKHTRGLQSNPVCAFLKWQVIYSFNKYLLSTLRGPVLFQYFNFCLVFPSPPAHNIFAYPLLQSHSTFDSIIY